MTIEGIIVDIVASFCPSSSKIIDFIVGYVKSSNSSELEDIYNKCWCVICVTRIVNFVIGNSSTLITVIGSKTIMQEVFYLIAMDGIKFIVCV